MPHPPAIGNRETAALQFYVTPTQRLSPGVLLLAIVVACGCVPPVLYALKHSHHARASRAGLSSSASADDDDDDDDPASRVDTIYLGDPSDAPVATRPARHPSTVHPFIVVKLPHSGEQTGQIPDTPAGHLLYNWLAAFNNKDPSASGQALPGAEKGVADAEMELRRETGGFTLLSAKEVEPGLLVFRLQDQTASGNEVLGTLKARTNAGPATIASFSLRAIEAPQTKLP